MPTNRSNAESTTLSEVLPEQGVAFHDAETPFQAILCKPKLLPIKSFSLERLEKLEKKIKQEMQQRREEEKQRRQQQNSWGTASRAHHPAVVGAAPPVPVVRPVLSGAAANPSFPPASAEVAQRRKQQQSQSPSHPQSTPAAAAAGPLEEGLDGGGRIFAAGNGGVAPGGLLSVEGPSTPPLSVPVPLTPKTADAPDAPRTPPPAVEVVENSPISGWSKKSLPFVPGGRSEEEEVAAATMKPSSFSPGTAPSMSSASSNSSPHAEHVEGPSPPFPGSPAGSITSSGRSSNHVAAQPPLALMPPPLSQQQHQPQPASTASRGHPPTTVHKSRRAKVTSVPPEDL